MKHVTQRGSLSLNPGLRPATQAVVIVFVLMVVFIPAAQAQTFQVLHTFTGGADGANPVGAGITMDKTGNLYGAAGYGGLTEPRCVFAGSCGTVFKMTRKGSGWIFNTLYEFMGGIDGDVPDAPVAFGPDGVLYGTTFNGGGNGCYQDGCGIVYTLKPPPTACKTALCPWTETVLYRFTGGSDGAQPAFGALTFDQAGNFYGTTSWGGKYSYYGNVYELTPYNGQWTQNVLYSFTGGNDGGASWSGVIFDASGNLYGTTTEGGYDSGGTAFELTPSGQGWALNVLHEFQPSTEGYSAFGNLIFDSSGNLWGTNRYGGAGEAGTVFELTPSNGSWDLTVLHSFTGSNGPQAGLVMDQAGNFYGTAVTAGKYAAGSVFKLSPSGGGWTYTVLHDFTGGSDGAQPYGQIVLDSSGNLYGTTFEGGMTGGDICGSYGCGVVWEITP